MFSIIHTFVYYITGFQYTVQSMNTRITLYNLIRYMLRLYTSSILKIF